MIVNKNIQCAYKFTHLPLAKGRIMKFVSG